MQNIQVIHTKRKVGLLERYSRDDFPVLKAVMGCRLVWFGFSSFGYGGFLLFTLVVTKDPNAVVSDWGVCSALLMLGLFPAMLAWMLIDNQIAKQKATVSWQPLRVLPVSLLMSLMLSVPHVVFYLFIAWYL